MRRKDREVTSREEKIHILKSCKVCRLGMALDGQPYIVPLNYGFSDENDQLTLYFHSANEGHKLEVLRANNKVCFEMDCEHELVEGDAACGYGYRFASIIGSGQVDFLTDTAEKAAALNAIMKHQTDQDTIHTFAEQHLNAVTVYRLTVSEFSGKRRS